jgi:hypothetical protein
MIRLRFLLAFCMLIPQFLSAQEKSTAYAFELSQFVTTSGFRSGTEAYITVIPDSKKQLSLGVYFCSEYKKIVGISVHHERALINIHRNQVPLLTPYAFYDFIYRKNCIREILPNKNVKGDFVTYASMEHHIGVGLRMNISPKVCLKTETGYGIYLGSIKKPSIPNEITGEICGTNGFGWLTKVGLCFII